MKTRPAEPGLAQFDLGGMIVEAVKFAVRDALTTAGLADVAQRRLLRVTEASTYLAISKREIFNMIANRQLPAVKHGSRTMIDVQDLNHWIEENKT